MNFRLKTPILYLAFNRLDSVKQTFPEIQKAKPRQLFISCDGPRTKEEKKDTDAVRKYILENINWKCEVKTFFRDKNVKSKVCIPAAISWFFDNVEQGIILEDDCMPNPSFFKFCEEMLDRYKDNPKVFSVAGYNYLRKMNIKESYFLSRYFSVWGWATWKDKWVIPEKIRKDYFKDLKSGKLKKIIKNPIERLILKRAIKVNPIDKIGTWDSAFWYLHFKNNGICIKPKINLVKNIGFIEDSTHTSENIIDNKFYCVENFELKFPLIHPKKIEINYKLSKREFNRDMLRIILKKMLFL